ARVPQPVCHEPIVWVEVTTTKEVCEEHRQLCALSSVGKRQQSPGSQAQRAWWHPGACATMSADVYRDHHSVARRLSSPTRSLPISWGAFLLGWRQAHSNEEQEMNDLTVEVYDTTLRDGAQQECMNLSVADKMAIAALLHELGVGVIEGGWPGAVPKDTEFFGLASKELPFFASHFAAFGMTRRAGSTAAADPQVRALLDCGAPVITLVAKSDIRHAERALKVSGDENLAMIEETVAFLVGEGRRVLLDAEHFFDGYAFDPDYAVKALLAGRAGGASTLVLCDTNGGMLPDDVARVVA